MEEGSVEGEGERGVVRQGMSISVPGNTRHAVRLVGTGSRFAFWAGKPLLDAV